MVTCGSGLGSLLRLSRHSLIINQAMAPEILIFLDDITIMVFYAQKMKIFNQAMAPEILIFLDDITIMVFNAPKMKIKKIVVENSKDELHFIKWFISRFIHFDFYIFDEAMHI